MAHEGGTSEHHEPPLCWHEPPIFAKQAELFSNEHAQYIKMCLFHTWVLKKRHTLAQNFIQ